MKKNLLFLILFSALATAPALGATDYARLYENAQVADFELVHKIDPYQNEDYQKYAYAPYPLFRLSSDVYFKNQAIPAGYYILTPRVIKNHDYVFFKEAGKVSYIIPVVKKELVPVDFYHNNLPTPKLTKWQNFCKKTNCSFKFSKQVMTKEYEIRHKKCKAMPFKTFLHYYSLPFIFPKSTQRLVKSEKVRGKK